MNNLEEQVQKLLAGMDEHNGQEPEKGIPGNEATEDIQDVYVLIVREHEEVEENPQVVESEPVKPQDKPNQPFPYLMLGIVLICAIPMLTSIIFQVYLFQNPPIATITILPKTQTVTLSGTLQLGRLLQPITISQSQTTPTTGKGHQEARNATGFITFYNGQFNSVTVAAGTILTGSDGTQIATDQDAYIPPESQTIPPTLGHITVSAHAIVPSTKGNIPTGDINQSCCAPSILAQNTAPFHNGQDERTFTTVTKNDVNMIASTLKSSLAASMQRALTAQAKQNETLFSLPCSPTVTPNHNVGDEAIQVAITVSLTCSAVAYNTNALENKVRALLTSQAQSKLAGYSLFGDINVSVKQASVSSASHPLVFLSFQAHGTWIYGLSRQSQQHLKALIAGKTKDQAARVLASLPGVERGSISFHGFGDVTRLPKNSISIHIIFVVM